MSTLVRPYCTRAQVQAELRNTDVALNDWLDQCINLASRRVEEWCSTDFWHHDHSSSALAIPNEWVLGNEIFFPWAIQASPAVVLVYTEDSIVINAEDYTVYGGINSSTNVIERFGRIKTGLELPTPGHKQLLTITGKFGTTLESSLSTESPPANLPASVNRACVLIASAWSMRNQKQIIALGGERAELFSNEVPKEVRGLLARWKVHRANL